MYNVEFVYIDIFAAINFRESFSRENKFIYSIWCQKLFF